MVDDSELKKLKDEDEIKKLATSIVCEVVKAAKQKISKEDQIKQKAFEAVSSAMKDVKTKADLDEIKNTALNLVNRLIKEICEDDHLITNELK